MMALQVNLGAGSPTMARLLPLIMLRRSMTGSSLGPGFGLQIYSSRVQKLSSHLCITISRLHLARLIKAPAFDQSRRMHKEMLMLLLHL